MRDFTLKTYRRLLEAFQRAGYQCQTFEDYITAPQDSKVLVLRHDVDEKAHNALAMARIENALGIRATYFFRIVKQSNVPEVIREIARFGHEIGYHYEDLALADGDMDKAIATFGQHLAYFRQYYPVRSVCMHGSSTSKHDNRKLWDRYHLSDFGLVGEPYISVDFNKVYYLTDIGRAWDGGRFAVRDVVKNDLGLAFHSTRQIIDALNEDKFPPQAMILAHTLWSDNTAQWYFFQIREYVRNRIKLISKKNKFVSILYKKMVKHHWKIEN